MQFTTKLRFLIYWPGKTVISHRFSIFHCIIFNRVVSLLSTLQLSLLRFTKQRILAPKKNISPKIKELFFYSQNEENSKMEDRLHVHRIRAKQWPNDRQYLIRTVHADTQNRTEIGVDRALMLTGTTDPGAGVEDRTNFLRQRGIACMNGKSPAPRPGETRQLFFTYTLVLEQIFFYCYISLLIYCYSIQISHNTSDDGRNDRNVAW